MVNICQRSTCKEGNCPGCKDGERWCDDSRCSPYCVGCQPPGYNFQIVNVLFATFLVLLLLGLFVAIFFYGPRLSVSHVGKFDPEADIIDISNI